MQGSGHKIHIIGTSHIARQSIDEIEQYISSHLPDIVAVELDARRCHALEQKKKPSMLAMARLGPSGFLFGLIAYFAEKKLGESVGVSPGSEMLHAVKLAKKHGLRLVFIDQDIEITLRRLSSALTWKEKLRFVADIFRAALGGKKQLKKMGLAKFDLTKVPQQEIIVKLIGMLRSRYPSIYNVLIKERNNVMARNLLTLSSLNPGLKIVAVVGAGHKDGITEIIEKNRQGKIDYTFSISQG